MLKPRFYQQESHDAAMAYMKQYTDPCCIVKPMGSGKSLTVSMLAASLHAISGGKRVLCLAPNKELTEQNYSKYISIGGKASIFSASISKSMRHPVVFATEQSFVKIAEKYAHEFCAIIPDECHKITNTFLKIVSIFREANPNIRICGLTATPYITNKGYIFELDDKNRVMQEAVDPFYKKMVYSISAEELIEHGFLTPPKIGSVDEHYNTEGLSLKDGKFDEKELAQAFESQSVTKDIIQDILIKTKNRKRCLIFATTLKHAEEIQSLIPNCGLVSGLTPKKERENILSAFANGNIKYLVNVAILTTGYDLPILDAIAILRPTESAGLYQQIIGRGTRLADGKEDFLVLDYTDNIPQFFEGKDSVFEPNIKTYKSGESVKIRFSCPECGTENESSKRMGFEYYSEVGGFAVDLAGDVIKTDNDQPMPAHYSRRCCGVVLKGRNKYERCSFWWAHKVCPSCGEKSDIAAKNCISCGLVLIRPDEKLNETAYVLKVGDTLTANVEKMEIKDKGSIVIAKFYTPHKNIMSKMYPTNKNHFITLTWRKFNKITQGGKLTPKQITYTIKKDGACVINEYIME